jgi:hypothetical protein
MNSVWLNAETQMPLVCSVCQRPIKALWGTDEGAKVYCSQRCMARGIMDLLTHCHWSGVKVRYWGRATKHDCRYWV